MARKFGIITKVSGLTAGFVVNSLTMDGTVQTAEAMNETGKITDIACYSRAKTISATGVLDDEKGDLVQAGDKLTIDNEDWLVESVSSNESNAAFVEVTVNARTADGANIIMLNDGSTPAP